MTYSLRYDLMTSDQVPATVIAEWILEDPLFARYVASRRLERVAGIEPAQLAWEARALPLHHTRVSLC